MNIAVIGLGLIGGSFCKAISQRTSHQCFGIDNDKETIEKAISQNAIIKEITTDELNLMDITIVCLHPRQTIDFILENKEFFKKNSVVIDTCGVKKEVVRKVSKALKSNQVDFLGTHPMAGREFSGFDYSLETLFDKASFIMTPSTETYLSTINIIENLAKEIGFKKTVLTTVAEHDSVIAFTSQLAHVVSNAYVKSPSIKKEVGFSAGSFLDLTRVARLNENMWADLFILNKSALGEELELIIKHLNEYKQAIENEDSEKLKYLLKEGSDLKKESLKEHNVESE